DKGEPMSWYLALRWTKRYRDDLVSEQGACLRVAGEERPNYFLCVLVSLHGRVNEQAQFERATFGYASLSPFQDVTLERLAGNARIGKARFRKFYVELASCHADSRPPNSLRLSGERSRAKRVRCSRGLGAGSTI